MVQDKDPAKAGASAGTDLPAESIEDSSTRSIRTFVLDLPSTSALIAPKHKDSTTTTAHSAFLPCPQALSTIDPATTGHHPSKPEPGSCMIAVQQHGTKQSPCNFISPLTTTGITGTNHTFPPDDSTNVDRTERFVRSIRNNQEKLLQYNPDDLDMNANNFTVIAGDPLHNVAEQFLLLHEQFVAHGVPSTVDIGYHYTKRSFIHQIQTRGLLTLAERQLQGLPEISNGRTFGDGVYTSHNPFSYHGFAGGDVGLFVARLQGSIRRHEDVGLTNTILGRAGDTDEVCVLQESSQCIPLVLFPASLVEVNNDDSMGNYMVHTYHCSLQKIMDEFFHQTVSIPWLVPSHVKQRQKAVASRPTAIFHYKAPDRLRSSYPSQWLRAVHFCETQEKCPICWNPMNNNVSDTVAITVCGHLFHEHCIRSCLNTMYSCPICRKCVGIPQGTSPSGSMTVTLEPTLHCLGHHGCGTIVIQYNMPAGLQASYHENPGVPFDETKRVAYVPNTQEGRDLLKRLKFAFCNGMIFRVGTSVTTGLPNCITWASIHHKTSVYSGAYGYPDASYFDNVNAELDHLHVPQADDL